MPDDGTGGSGANDAPDANGPAAANGPTDATPPGVRDAGPGDLSTLLRIQTVSLPDPSPAFLRTGLRAGLVLVAEPLPGARTVPRRAAPAPVDSRADPTAPRPDPVGYLLHTVDDRTVYAAEMAVAPAHRRRGHGSRLLEALAVRYADRQELRLTTRRSNEGALALYERLGFRVERRLPGRYDERTDGGGSEAGASDTGRTDAGESGTDAGESGTDAGESDADSGAEDGLLLVRDL